MSDPARLVAGPMSAPAGLSRLFAASFVTENVRGADRSTGLAWGGPGTRMDAAGCAPVGAWTEREHIRALLVFDGRALRARVTRHVERTIEGGTFAGELE